MKRRFLNLTEGFSTNGNADEIEFDSFFFSGGEPHIRIKSEPTVKLDVGITIRLNSMNAVGLLCVAVNALRNLWWCNEIHLFVPYFPGARQDRIMNEGEALTVKMYADIVNNLKLDSVTIVDPHSDVVPALLNNCTVETNIEFAKLCRNEIQTQHRSISELTYACPDAGAKKKFYELKRQLDPNGLSGAVMCDKVRDVVTGELTGFEVYSDNLRGKDCIIVDDICDGGGTFIGLAKELIKKNAGDLYLVVTHGIFSKGLNELAHFFKAIYTTDSWRSEFDWEQKEREKTEIVKIIPFAKFL